MILILGKSDGLYNTLVSNDFHTVKSLSFSSAKPRDFDGMLGTELPVSMYTTKTPIDMCRFNVPQLTEFLKVLLFGTEKTLYNLNVLDERVWIMAFNVTLYNISDISIMAVSFIGEGNRSTYKNSAARH